MKSEHENTKPSQGVRQLKLADQLPSCEIYINKPCYRLSDVSRGKSVVDIGCGFGRNKPIVEGVGGNWEGVEPYSGGNHTVVAHADDLPFDDGSFDVVVMDAVLEHLENVDGSFSEVSRVLKPGGVFVGYVAFMECFHEISYSHLSYMALQNFSERYGMKLEKISGGRRFGIDYHLGVLMSPIPSGWIRVGLSFLIRGVFRLKAAAAFVALIGFRRLSFAEANQLAKSYFRLECLRQSSGFSYLIRKI